MAKSNQTSRTRVIALLISGLGFLGIGAMFFMLLDQQAASTQDFSTVPAKVNFPAPELILEDLSGREVSLTGYRGNVVLVNLWATWCPPCREEMPTLQAFYQKYKANGFVLVAINQEETLEAVQPFVNEFGLTFPVWLDEKYEAQRKFNTMNLPSSYVIDGEGQVRLMWIGGISKRNLEKFVPDIILE